MICAYFGVAETQKNVMDILYLRARKIMKLGYKRRQGQPEVDPTVLAWRRKGFQSLKEKAQKLDLTDSHPYIHLPASLWPHFTRKMLSSLQTNTLAIRFVKCFGQGDPVPQLHFSKSK